MELIKDIIAVDLGIFLLKYRALIISDLHFGYEEYLQNKGVLVPKSQYKLIINRLKNILELTKPEIIVINGDLKHEFGKILRQEWKDITKFIEFLNNYCKNIIVIKGNHDVILDPIVKKANVELAEYKKFSNIIIAHGDKIIKTYSDIVIIGHDHPAIMLREKDKREKFKCFLKGKIKKTTVIVQPSFNPLIEGSDVISEKLLSPYLKNISDFDVFIVDDKKKEVLSFGKLKNCI